MYAVGYKGRPGQKIFKKSNLGAVQLNNLSPLGWVHLDSDIRRMKMYPPGSPGRGNCLGYSSEKLPERCAWFFLAVLFSSN